MMKLLAASLAIAVTSSPLAAAAPKADAPQTQAAAIVAEASDASAERLALARRFLASTSPADNLMNGIRAGYWQAASQTITDESELASAREGLDELMARLEPHLRQAMPTLLESRAQVYAREFSAEDLRQMAAFAESSAGSRYLKRFISLETDPLVLEAQAVMWEKLTPVMEEYRREMCGKQAALRIAAGDSKAKCSLTAEPEARPS